MSGTTTSLGGVGGSVNILSGHAVAAASGGWGGTVKIMAGSPGGHVDISGGKAWERTGGTLFLKSGSSRATSSGPVVMQIQ